jgi:hypothetical protein
METLKPASELRTEMKVSDNYFNRLAEKINRFKNHGRLDEVCDTHVCTKSELDYAVNRLKTLGYSISFKHNSHNVRCIVVTW